jgi:hypothetical protein
MAPDKQQERSIGEGGRGIPKETQEHLQTAREEVRKSIEALLPPDFVEHRKAARREALLAARSMIQHVLDRMEA